MLCEVKKAVLIKKKGQLYRKKGSYTEKRATIQKKGSYTLYCYYGVQDNGVKVTGLFAVISGYLGLFRLT